MAVTHTAKKTPVRSKGATQSPKKRGTKPRRLSQKIINGAASAKRLLTHWDRLVLLALGSVPALALVAWPHALILLPTPWIPSSQAGVWASTVITLLWLYPVPVCWSFAQLWRRRWREKRILQAWCLLVWAYPFIVVVVISFGYLCQWRFQC